MLCSGGSSHYHLEGRGLALETRRYGVSKTSESAMAQRAWNTIVWCGLVLCLAAGGCGVGGGGSDETAVPSPENSLVAVEDGLNVPADGLARARIRITVKDAEGRSISGLTVTLSAVGSAVTIRQPRLNTEIHCVG